MLKADQGAMYVLNQDIPTERQIKWLRTLCKRGFMHEPQIQKELTSLFNRIDKARDTRNFLVHGLWIRGPERGTALVQTVKLSRANMVRFEPVTRAQLHELFAELDAIAEELHDISETLGIIGKSAGL
jgi:hypothetical protein